jgi:SAM-dependent methyltransferase
MSVDPELPTQLDDAGRRGQVVETAAEVYDRFFVPALFAPWADPVLDAAGVTTGDRVLDVGCGTGFVARAAHRRAGRTGTVTGLDRNQAMLSVARRSPEAIAWRIGVAEDLPFADSSFDRVLCTFVLMFVDDRRRAVTELARVTRPGGSLCITTWAAVDESPGYAAMVELLARVVGDDAAAALRAPFTIGTTAQLAALVAPAFPDVVVTHRDGMARFDSIEAWVHTDIRGWTLAGAVDDATYAHLLAEATVALAPFVDERGRVAFAAPAIVAVGRAT